MDKLNHKETSAAELLEMPYKQALKIVMQEEGVDEYNAQSILENTVYGGDVLAIDDEDAYNADPDGYIKEQQRKKFQAEASG